MELFGSVRKRNFKNTKNETISRPWIIFYKKNIICGILTEY